MYRTAKLLAGLDCISEQDMDAVFDETGTQDVNMFLCTKIVGEDVQSFKAVVSDGSGFGKSLFVELKLPDFTKRFAMPFEVNTGVLPLRERCELSRILMYYPLNTEQQSLLLAYAIGIPCKAAMFTSEDTEKAYKAYRQAYGDEA